MRTRLLCSFFLLSLSSCSVFFNSPCEDAETLVFLAGAQEAVADARALLTKDPDLLKSRGLDVPLTPDDIKERLVGYSLTEKRIAQILAKKAEEGASK